MRLNIILENPQSDPSSPSNAHVFDERGGVIGRSAECDWVLECPQKTISRRHAMVAFEDGQFYLYDSSANGVFHNDGREPVGMGWRVPLLDGDRLRMGELRMRVQLLDVPASAPSEPPASLAPVEEVAVSRHAGYAGLIDGFRPPRVTIPDDWDPLVEPAAEPPAPSLSRHLDALEPACVRALWKGLGLGGDGMEGSQLSPELVGSLARSLRICMEAILALRAEFDAVEQRLTRRRPAAPAPSMASLGQFEDADSFCRALIGDDEDGRARLLEDLSSALEHMRGRHADVVAGFEGAVDTVLGQFAPEKIEQRRKNQPDEARQSWSDARGRLSPGGANWAFYRAWHDAQRAEGYPAVHQLFEKKFVAIYARRLGEKKAAETA